MWVFDFLSLKSNLDRMDVPDLSKLSDEERLALAKKIAVEIAGSLPKELYAGSFTLNSKLPYKACSFREVLIHRVSDLADASIELLVTGNLVPAFVMVRSVVETTAMMYWLSERSKDFLEKREEGAFDEFLMKGMLGSRDGTTGQSSHNVLTAVNHLNKEFDGIRGMYDQLCEFTHPNWAGVMGSYSVIDKDKFLLCLGKHHQKPPIAYGLAPLIASLAIFRDYYNSSAGLLKEINDSYEQKAL